MKSRIKLVRKESKLNQEDFGKRIRIGKTSVSKLENGENNPSEQTILLICQEFGISEKWLRTGVGDMHKRRLPADEVASYTENLLDHSEEENPFYDIIVEMMRTYHELDEASKQAALNYFRLLRKNLEQKKED